MGVSGRLLSGCLMLEHSFKCVRWVVKWLCWVSVSGGCVT